MSDTVQTYFQLAKYDPFQGIAYGIATAQQRDLAGETLDYEGSKPYFKAWSDGCQKDSRGLSWGNIRLQHSDKDPVGKVNKPLEFDDAAKTIKVEAKIVDPVAKEMLREGVLTGFSIGGKYVTRDAATGVYSADPIEISVVDRPCLPSATFESVKADGFVELKKFADQATVDELVKRLADIKKESAEPSIDVTTKAEKCSCGKCEACKAEAEKAQTVTKSDYETLLKKLEELAAELAEVKKAKDQNMSTPTSEELQKKAAIVDHIKKCKEACTKAHDAHCAMAKAHHDEHQSNLDALHKAITGEEPATVEPQVTKEEPKAEVKKEEPVVKSEEITDEQLEKALEAYLAKHAPAPKAEEPTLEKRLEAIVAKFVEQNKPVVRKQATPIFNTDNVKKDDSAVSKDDMKKMASNDPAAIVKVFSNLKKLA